ncbi:MAG: hypothetical protein ACD_24C00408G0005 [uncultured bacterium]|nr:MAG: hypothetical protein ACD_24C00408G0005 [uncultured bacterium]
MQFIINDHILKDYPQLFIGLIVVKDIDNEGNNTDIDRLLKEIQSETKLRYKGLDVTQHPHVIPWREAYSKFGAKPREFRCSAEALLRMVLNGRELKHINKLVDLYNYISLKYTLTVGGEDLDTIKGDLVLAYADGTEPFVALGQTENDTPLKGEVVYKDNLGVVCRRWNWREGDRTKLEEHTKNAVVVLEGIPPIENSVIEQATYELSKLIHKYCAGSVEVTFLNSVKPSVIL